MEITKEAFEFLTGFYPSNYEDPVVGLCEWATNRAYLDMSRTLRFKRAPKETRALDEVKEDLRNPARAEVVGIFYKQIGALDGESFDKWHQATCEMVMEHYNTFTDSEGQSLLLIDMSYGQAQKWLNMTLKYIWLVVQTNKSFGYYKAVLDNQDKLHIPLDSYILAYIKKKRICKVEAGFCSSTWSKISDYDSYLAFQMELRNALAPSSPIKWELVEWNNALQ